MEKGRVGKETTEGEKYMERNKGTKEEKVRERRNKTEVGSEEKKRGREGKQEKFRKEKEEVD